MCAQSQPSGVRGILAPVARLDLWLHVVLVVLVVTSAVRYVMRHGLGLTGVLVLLGAVGLVLAYSARSLLPGRVWWPATWVTGIVVLWTALTIAAPSFAWCAVPVAFAVLRIIPFRPATAVVALMTLVVAGSWLRITGTFDPTLIAGPLGIALVTTIAYRALERTQADLAEEQHRSGVLAERTRLSRDIHDSVGQGLSSINLLLQAAEQSWTTDPQASREHVGTAAATARDGLDEVRRVVRDLAPADVSNVESALGQVAREAALGFPVEVRIDGTSRPVPPAVASALVRTARGALANVREHADASRAAVTLTYHADEIRLDIRDDGRGFRPANIRPDGLRGRGLRGIRERAEQLGGQAEMESAPGEGATVSVRFPLEDR
ncbi:sensor histidine kinase [Smaragdicoccus niigatensis]|uniref:sensor histidine kinase n=3 Tax=Smaragdicoccus niigatensis TaxID=359359 RepID=UPI00039C9CB1|nr:sensor histidine kinase [Smaragdicoccus niigatensis]